MPELCPKCGSEKLRALNTGCFHNGEYVPFQLTCPLDPKDCRIEELERKTKALETEYGKQAARTVAAIAERDEAQSLVVALRDKAQMAHDHIVASIQYGQQEDGSAYPASSYDYASYELATVISEALSNSSATAQRVKEEWEREALEKAWERVMSMDEAVDESELTEQGRQLSRRVHAAILGEKGKG